MYRIRGLGSGYARFRGVWQMSILTGVAADSTPPSTLAREPRPGVAVLSAHGGSGATTVANGLRLPELADPESCDRLHLVVVTARTTTSGFDRLLASIAEVPASMRVVVAATADAPLRAPAGVRARAKVLQRSGRDVALVTLPYEPSWRHCPAAMQRPSKAYRRQLAKLTAVITHHERTGA